MFEKVCIIAEAGVNHNGDIDLAKELIDIAAECGADYVKFQTFRTELLVDVEAPKAEYQIENMPENVAESQFEMLKKLELSHENHFLLKKYCESKGVKFLSTPFDKESLIFLIKLGIDFIKIPSGELSNLLYLKEVAKHNIPVILSTGMGDMFEVETALKVLEENGLPKSKIKVLQCTTNYPADFSEINLSVITTLKEKLNVEVGYSDHTIGIEASIAAVALGAKVIEKHFTISKKMIGPDHKASLEKEELKNLIFSIRNIEKAIGNGVKVPSESEKKNMKVARKSAFALKNIVVGEIITEEMIEMKRPGDGVYGLELLKIINCPSTRNYSKGDKIEK